MTLSRMYTTIQAVIFMFAVFAAHEVIRLNDEVSNLKHGEKWCNVSYKNRIETRPCTMSAELENVAEVKF